jgi:hypothetical protein
LTIVPTVRNQRFPIVFLVFLRKTAKNFLTKFAFLQGVSPKKCRTCSTTDRVVEQVQYIFKEQSGNVVSCSIKMCSICRTKKRLKMEKISNKIKLTAILAAAVVVVCLGAASIILHNSAEKPRGYGLYSWGSHMKFIPESERETFMENYRSLRPSFSQSFQMLQEYSPAVPVLLCISWLGIITLVILGLFCINTWANRMSLRGASSTVSLALHCLQRGSFYSLF